MDLISDFGFRIPASRGMYLQRFHNLGQPRHFRIKLQLYDRCSIKRLGQRGRAGMEEHGERTERNPCGVVMFAGQYLPDKVVSR